MIKKIETAVVGTGVPAAAVLQLLSIGHIAEGKAEIRKWNRMKDEFISYHTC